MIEFRDKSPCDRLLPFRMNDISLHEISLGTVTCIAPFPGQQNQVKALLNGAWPEPSTEIIYHSGILRWFGREQAMLISASPPHELSQNALVTEQSDAWAAVELAGEHVEEVLARLVPLDLTVVSFPQNTTARSLLSHIPISITRRTPESFEIWCYRSMATTMIHEISTAIRHVAARHRQT